MPVVLYEKVAEAFVMVVREDEKGYGEATWRQASGFALLRNFAAVLHGFVWRIN